MKREIFQAEKKAMDEKPERLKRLSCYGMDLKELVRRILAVDPKPIFAEEKREQTRREERRRKKKEQEQKT